MDQPAPISIEAQYFNSLQLLETKLKNRNLNIDEVADLIPGYIHFNHFDDFSFMFVDQEMEFFFNTPSSEIVQLGYRFIENHFHPDTWHQTVPQIIKNHKTCKNNNVVGYFQKIRSHETAEYHNFIVFTTVSKIFNCFISVANPVYFFGCDTKKLDMTFDDNEFAIKNFNQFALLSPREIEILRLIGIGSSRNSITCQLHISKHTFDNHRKHIREKLNIKNAAELFHFIHAFNLV